MSWRKELFRACTELGTGPGGWERSCYVPLHPRKHKGEIHRLYRRASKARLKRDCSRRA